MRLLSATLSLTLLAAACTAGAAPLPAPHQVDIPANGLTLHAQLYKPDGDGPFPTVIALHGWADWVDNRSRCSRAIATGRNSC